jgi:hypothetical protein
MAITVKIEGREALPIRAIPFVTAWQESPDSIVRALSESTVIKVGANLEIPNKYSLIAYQMGDQGRYKPVPAGQWKSLVIDINSLTKKLIADERKNATNENYGPWRVAAVLKLPDNCFVWLDEFQSWYSKTRPMLACDEDETRIRAWEEALAESRPQFLEDMEAEIFQSADNLLCLTPILPNEIEGKVWRHIEVAAPLADMGSAKHYPIKRCDTESFDTEDTPIPTTGEPFLRKGKNNRKSVEEWVVWQANDKANKFDNIEDLVTSIRLLAERWGFESERQKLTNGNITKMIPSGLTGGRSKNKGRSKNQPAMIYGKGESKEKLNN